MLAEFFLLENLAWEWAERRLTRKSIQKYKPFPLPSEEERLFSPSNVTIIVPTVGWDPESFTRAMVSWLANKPLEIIVVTTYSEHKNAESLIDSRLIQAANMGTEIMVRSISRPNKRHQLVEGITDSTGSIIAFVDDDVLWNPDTLQHLLAPFQQPDVGLVGGPVESYVPKDRQDASVISAYEVAALRNRTKRRNGNKASYSLEGSASFTVSGATMLLRAEIVKERDFQNAFRTEMFAGVQQNTGDDAFVTRWVLFQHLQEGRKARQQWKLGMQFTPEATVSTTLITDSRFIDQMKRWSRTGLRLRIICLFRDPGLRTFWRAKPYMCRKMVEGMYNPIFNLFWYVSFFIVLRRTPLMAILIALYYLYSSISGILAFLDEFPYCQRKIYAAIIADKISLVSDFYSWATLATESWSSRQGVDEGRTRKRERMDLDK
ncbi:nucleotide-diphospho-sugar transferase [Xylaria cf. heliscus]|nr:nucleotide-diphospho-sugar transferase [Xylaria cf. heliscus]